MADVSRYTKIEQSLQTYVKDQLFNVQGIGADQVAVEDAFEYERFEAGLDKTYVAAGFNFDDGGEQAECGSSLRRYVHSIEFYVFADSPQMGEQVAEIIKQAVIRDEVIALHDYGATGAPIIDYLEILPRGGARAERIPVRDPRPWEENIYRTTVKVVDEWYPE
jgi:hypothetical protein